MIAQGTKAGECAFKIDYHIAQLCVSQCQAESTGHLTEDSEKFLKRMSFLEESRGIFWLIFLHFHKKNKKGMPLTLIGGHSKTTLTNFSLF